MEQPLQTMLLIAGCLLGGLVMLFLLSFPTGFGPRWLLSLDSRIARLGKGRKKWSWTTIEPGLLLGSLPRMPCHLEELRAEGVGAVLTLNESWEVSLTPRCIEDCHMISRQLSTPDFFAPKHRDVVEAVAFIRKCMQQGIGVYVHCNGGRGRSAVCVICYLIYEHGWTPDEALSYVKGKRSIANMKAWGGLHKQWRAVKRFARELKAAKQFGMTTPGEHLVTKKASAKVAPEQVYKEHSPTKVNSVDGLLTKYRGQEQVPTITDNILPPPGLPAGLPVMNSKDDCEA